jgi:hypothetical protein
MKITIKELEKKASPNGAECLKLIAEELGKAIGNPAFFGVDGGNLTLQSYANNSYDKVLATFTLLTVGLCYFSHMNGRWAFYPMYKIDKWVEVWSRIRDFDFTNIEIEVK